MSQKGKLLSVVVPVYCEELVIDEFYRRCKAALETLRPSLDHELIFVDDGSRDRSLELLRNLAAKDPAVKVISFSRNFGHQLAITAGLDRVSGDVAVIIDSDLQDPPEVIAQMIEKWRAGAQVVHGVRKKRAGESFLKLILAAMFYRVLRMLSDVEMPLDTGDFKLLDRKAVMALRAVREETRYMRGLVAWIGFNQQRVEYDRDARYAGETHYPLRKQIRLAVDGLTSFSDRPLRIVSRLGAVAMMLSLVAMGWIIVSKFLSPEGSIQGWTSLLAAVLFMGGVQLLSLGVLGEYIGRTFRESKQRPLYVVAENVGFSEPDRA